MKQEEISIQDSRIPYGSQSKTIHDIYPTDLFILQNDTAKVLLPGEFVEVHSDSLSKLEGEVPIEPRVDSPSGGKWPKPCISRVIQGSVRIPDTAN